MNKHTPGPWRAVDGSLTGVGIAHMTDGNYDQPYKVAAIIADDCPEQCANGWRYVAVINGESTGEVDADAALIAAAPDLLAALRECVDLCKGHRENDAKRARYERVIAAIAKATGGQQ
jgi:hypothetical protein